MRFTLLIMLLTAGLCAGVYAVEDSVVKVRVDGRMVPVYKGSAAFLVGMADYNADWPALPGVRKEMEQVKAILEKHGFHVEVLINPSKDQLDRELNSFTGRYCSDPASRFLFYFKGHGRAMKTIYGDELAYIVPVNAPDPNNDLARFLSSSVEMEVMDGYARKLGSRHAVFFFDAAFSGPMFSTSLVTPAPLTGRSLQPVRQFITSASGNDPSVKTGLFPGFLEKALTGQGDQNGDGYVTGTELAAYLQMNILTASSHGMHPQYGVSRDASWQTGDFIFVLPGSVKETVVVQPTPPPPATPVKVEEPKKIPEQQKPPAAETTDILAGIKLIRVEGGEFLMGNPRGRGEEVPVHKVKLNDFYIGATEITQKQYEEIMGMNPSKFRGCDDCPVDMVSYNDAVSFTIKLSQKTGKTFRLPTEAEWEYAARGGKHGRNYRYSGSHDPGAVAWYDRNSSRRSHPAGKKAPNELGIYDMSGNILEWCRDWFDGSYYRKSPFDNPSGPSFGEARSVRGGSWKLDSGRLSCYFRYGIRPSARYDDVGFRVVQDVEQNDQ